MGFHKTSTEPFSDLDILGRSINMTTSKSERKYSVRCYPHGLHHAGTVSTTFTRFDKFIENGLQNRTGMMVGSILKATDDSCISLSVRRPNRVLDLLRHENKLPPLRDYSI